ncbi:MAG: Unannotated protein [Actinomycetota bacterium]|jgi:hypothetical protein|nr:Unannotated protein [Actinomycetota bacterium]
MDIVTCALGHANSADDYFCTTCGLAIGDEHPGPQPVVGAADPPRTSRQWLVPVIALGVLVLVGLAFVGYQATRQKVATLRVTMSLFNGFDPCSVGLGYIDIPGATVVVEADGDIVGSGNLSRYGDEMGGACVFTALIPNIPSDKSIYTLALGRSSRGTLTSTQSELSAANWEWGITLGD